MKKLTVISALLFALYLPNLVNAQQSIGFSDSTDFQHIIDYRLPDWGYSNFYLESGSFRTSGQYYKSATDYDSYSNYQTNRQLGKNIDTGLDLTPAFQYYRESEHKVISLNSTLSANTRFLIMDTDVKRRRVSQGEQVDTLDYNQNTEFKSYGADYSLNLNTRFFLVHDAFLITGLHSNITYYSSNSSGENSRNNITNSTSDKVERMVELLPKIGFGYGRIRNVSPQIRAIRLNERYKSIGKSSLTNTEITSAAEHFTKLQGYKNTTDRHQKYFWGDMNQLLSGKLDATEAYDLFYLRDVLNENLGQRLEGFDVFVTGSYSYQNELIREEQTEDRQTTTIERDFELHKTIITTAQLRWYKNLNLNHQLSLTTKNEINLPLQKDNSFKWQFQSISRLSWLWTITDRYLLTSSLSNRFYKPKYKTRYSNTDRYRNQLYLSGNLSYFIENSVSLSGGASFGYITDSVNTETREVFNNTFSWDVFASIRYYFGRNLF